MSVVQHKAAAAFEKELFVHAVWHKAAEMGHADNDAVVATHGDLLNRIHNDEIDYDGNVYIELAELVESWRAQGDAPAWVYWDYKQWCGWHLTTR